MSRSGRIDGARVLCSLYSTLLYPLRLSLSTLRCDVVPSRNLPTLLSLEFDVGPLDTLTPLGGANACHEIPHKFSIYTIFLYLIIQSDSTCGGEL